MVKDKKKATDKKAIKAAKAAKQEKKAGKKEKNVRTCTMQVSADCPLDPTHFHFPTMVDADHQ